MMKSNSSCSGRLNRVVSPRAQRVSGYREQGSVLVISLLILLVMSLLSISSLNNSVLEEKMAANSRNNQLAFQAAEAALRAAESFISNSMVENEDVGTGDLVDASCTNGLCDCDNRTPGIGGSGVGINGCPKVYWTDAGLDVWNSAYRPYLGTGPLLNGNDAKYIIEYMGKTQPTIPIIPLATCTSCPDMYRITALGINVNSGAQVMLQSTYRK